MVIIGLTGGIASGKSIVANEFSQLGVEIIDTDRIARELVAPGHATLAEIRHYFGETILHSDNSLNRKKLREIIFTNPPKKIWLENLLHPLIWQKVYTKVQLIKSAYCIIVIPLLIETALNPLVERILVVDVKPETQRLRLLQRDNITVLQAKQIMDAQAKREQRLAKAHDILHNEGTIEELRQQAFNLHQYYLILAKKK